MEDTDKKAAQLRLVGTMAWAYMLLLHVALAVVLYFLYPTPAAPQYVATDVLALACYGIAIVSLLAATKVSHFIIRCALIETATVAGFSLALLKETPHLYIPFLAVGVLSLLLAKKVQP